MTFIIVSGRSGSGKTTALQALEDIGYYCVDNLPAGLLPELAQQLHNSGSHLQKIAVGIDARNVPSQLEQFPSIIEKLKQNNVHYEIVYLDCDDNTLLQRFSSTRRKHPLTSNETSLAEAIGEEKYILSAIAVLSDLKIDTSHITIHELRHIIKSRIGEPHGTTIALQFQSFGFKHGVPSDADFVFDVRCLPNPYWEPELRAFTGKDPEIAKFLEKHGSVKAMEIDIATFLHNWLNHFHANNRTYMTIAIGCTGGHHRSVYISEKLGENFLSEYPNVQVRHRELT
ncbi:MAG: RNase adapter RapZ [Gammaproteobacteria bacterium]|nr:MAG: RNase adapter RapZ [Gammaproteobacteria bacterium]